MTENDVLKEQNNEIHRYAHRNVGAICPFIPKAADRVLCKSYDDKTDEMVLCRRSGKNKFAKKDINGESADRKRAEPFKSYYPSQS